MRNKSLKIDFETWKN